MRWLPQSLYGRFVWLLAVGYTAALLLGTVVHTAQREDLAARVLAWQAGQRTADTIELLRRLPASARGAAIARLNDPRFLVNLETKQHHDVLVDGGKIRHIILGVLSRRLGVGQWQVHVSERSDLWGRKAVSADIEGPVDGQQSVVIHARFWHPHFSWPHRLMLDMGLLAATLAAASWFAVRSITRPLERLAHASSGLGENLSHPPLPESGPLEVRRAARAFNLMQDRLLRHFESRARMVLAMSHDLRTPLTRMRLRTEMLEDTEQRERFERGLIEMERIVNDTLTMMRSTRNDEPEIKFDLADMVQQLVQDRVECGESVRYSTNAAHLPYRGKRGAIKRCLDNLIDNAVKYGDRVQVVLTMESARIIVQVLDSGPGIPEAALERVFEPFFRVESSRSRDTGGTGLGLCIARDLAHTFGGRVTLANREQGGLEACLILPRERRPSSSGTA